MNETTSLDLTEQGAVLFAAFVGCICFVALFAMQVVTRREFRFDCLPCLACRACFACVTRRTARVRTNLEHLINEEERL